ncbi:MarR family winged helix-turn-helix transcriptional regulator [Aureimonas psammosilenae]|uniref:MarR family winged helix-turn-helix transcriptional regulator n=1 Tax=Aureimonas psammosilenae TaxID=2495496 RepID=UPI00126043FB|nr:MarR family winged helix-turn-helix transcriptional regulator [Aureimonas psammosilenae]
MTPDEGGTIVAASGSEEEVGELVPTLLSIAKSSRAFLTLLLADVGLHPGQDQLLQSLIPGETISVSVLADQLAVRPSTVSKMLDRLIDRDLVKRTASSEDARRTMVALTPEGEKARNSVQEVWDRLEAELKSSFGAEEFETQVRVLGKVDELLTTRLRRLR